ncbi:MAG: hypothetical protein ACXWYS_04625 [Gaiellaceae bacterium]
MDDAMLRRSLASVVVPGELEARRRSWRVARTAFERREELPVPALPRRWPPVAAAAALMVVVAAALSPPGRAVIGDVRDAIGREQVVEVKNASPSLFSLPAKGRLLVDSSRGPWIVNPDGSKRLLGAYEASSWSPFGRFVVASKAAELDALAPKGTVRWSLARPDVTGARWGGSETDTRIAYLSGGSLQVVAGDGRSDRVLVKRVADVAPGWKPGGEHVLAYVAPKGAVRIVDADSGHVLGGWREGSPEQLAFSADGKLIAARDDRLLTIYTAQAFRVTGISSKSLGLGRQRFLAASWSPTAPALAFALYDPKTNRSTVSTVEKGGRGDTRQLFSGTGRITDVAWSPDGKWVLIAWASADQWVFIRTGEGATKIVTRSSITEQLNGTPGGQFPTIAGWV